jgi:phosphatidylinositol alpha-1,6-mannosyltransferase
VRILHITHSFPRDDDDIAGAFIARLCRAQHEVGHEVSVLAPADRGKGGASRFGGVPVSRIRYAPASWETLAYTGTMVDGSRSLRGAAAAVGMVLSLAEAARATRADIVHAHWWVPGGLAAWLSRRLGGDRYVVTLHGTDVALMERSVTTRALGRTVLRGAAAVSAVSRYLADRGAVQAGIAEQSIMVQPMPLNTAELNRTSAGGGGVVTVGRLSRQKRIDVIIEAVAAARSHGAEARLTIVGDGPERTALERLAAAISIADVTHFVGTVAPHELPAAVGDADVFAFAGEGEGLGLALAEALILGVPVVAVRSGGVTDLLGEHDAPGIRLVPPGNVRAMGAAIADLLAESAVHRSAAATVGGDLRGRLSPSAGAAAFDRFYASALARAHNV